MRYISALVITGMVFLGTPLWAQIVDLTESSGTTAPKKTGKKAAAEYFKEDAERLESSRDHYLALQMGGFFDTTAFVWGARNKVDNVGKFTTGVTYRIGEWTRLMDLFFRASFNFYEIPEGKTTLMTLMPVVMFPESNSKFPLYFGFGLGPGVYFKQVDDESNLALAYELLLGVRFFDVAGSTGFLFEAGLRNHLHLLSDGQFNGAYAAVGILFAF